MRQVYKYDSEGNYKEPIMIEDNEPIPPNCTDKELLQPNWELVFDKAKNEWIETITDTEKEALTNIEQPKTEIEILREENAQLNLAVIDLYEILMG